MPIKEERVQLVREAHTSNMQEPLLVPTPQQGSDLAQL